MYVLVCSNIRTVQQHGSLIHDDFAILLFSKSNSVSFKTEYQIFILKVYYSDDIKEKKTMITKSVIVYFETLDEHKSFVGFVFSQNIEWFR